MKLSTQAQHAIMAMLALAIHDDEGALRLGDIAKQQGISLSYLEQVFARLRNGGLVEGIRGPGGGYRLARPAEDITLVDIVLSAEDADDVAPVDGKANPVRASVGRMWQEFSRKFYTFLEGITLASLLEGHERPRKTFRMGETASLIARMFPARVPAGMPHHVAF